MSRDDGLEGGVVASCDEAVEELALAQAGDAPRCEEPSDLTAATANCPLAMIRGPAVVRRASLH